MSRQIVNSSIGSFIHSPLPSLRQSMGDCDFIFDPACAADIPPTPDAFPRNSWLNYNAFDFPPYHPGKWVYDACWAGCEASMAWSRVLGVPVEVDISGSPYSPLRPPRPGDTVDDTAFMLAIFDKVHEM